MKSKKALIGAAFILACGSALLAQKIDSPGGTAPDAKFAKEAAIGDMMEVELGKVAVQKASSDKVKQFGQKMIDDHSKAESDLKSVAAKNNIVLPTSLDAKHQAMVDRYSNMSGTAFDRAYTRDMVKDHTKDISEFQKEANDGTNPDLKNLASSTLPTLQEHLKMARDAETSLGITSRK